MTKTRYIDNNGRLIFTHVPVQDSTVQTKPMVIKFVNAGPPVIVPADDVTPIEAVYSPPDDPQAIDRTWDMIVLAAQSSK